MAIVIWPQVHRRLTNIAPLQTFDILSPKITDDYGLLNRTKGLPPEQQSR